MKLQTLLQEKYRLKACPETNSYSCFLGDKRIDSLDIQLKLNSLDILQEICISIKPMNDELKGFERIIKPKDFEDINELQWLLERVEINGNKKLKKDEEILELEKRQMSLFPEQSFKKETVYAKETT